MEARISISLRWVYLEQFSISTLYTESGGSNLINNAAREAEREHGAAFLTAAFH
jgi:hypothetical protein